MTMMNEIFREYLDDFIIVYLDDILIYSKNMDDHERHLELVLRKLREHKLYAKESKCDFGKTSIEFLGHIVSDKGIQVDDKKIQAIKGWNEPKNV